MSSVRVPTPSLLGAAVFAASVAVTGCTGILGDFASGAQPDGGSESSSSDDAATDGGPDGDALAPSAKLAIDKSNVAFGTVDLGATAPQTTVTITNVGNAATAALTTALSGANAASFALGTDTCKGVTLAPRASCAVQISASTMAAGMFEATLTVKDSNADMATSALGVNVITPSSLAIAPKQYDFMTHAVNSNGGSKSFLVTNNGTAATPALTTSLTGPDKTEFAISADACNGQTVPAGLTCSITVTFDPVTYGAKTASLAIAGGGGASASLLGTGQDMVTLTVTKSGSGSGTVTGDQIDCGSTCSETVTRTTSAPTITLTATPDASSTFAGWTGPCSGTGPCTVTMTMAQTVGANFSANQFPLTLETTFYGPASAAVTSSPSGISTTTAGTVSANFANGQMVTLTVANPTTLWSWGGACSGTSSTCTVTMSTPQTVSLAVTAYNYVFQTSTMVSGNLGGLAGGDAVCAARAQAAGLPGHYLAWLSTSTTSAKSRIAATGANGWIRLDGLPFTSSLADLTTSYRVYYPPELTELGTDVGTAVLTGTGPDGTAVSGSTCGDWTSTANYAAAGWGYYGAGEWTYTELYGCSVGFALYCFGTDINRPVVPAATSGRRAFVTKGTFNTASGLSGADTLCQTEASSAGLATPTNFRALLSTTTAAASSRFNLAGANWVRLDGIPVASDVNSFMSGALLSALDVHADGTYSTGTVVLGGSSSPTATATSSSLTCGDWTVSTGTSGPPEYGIGASTNSEFFGFGTSSSVPCSTTSAPIYCLDQ